MMMVCAGVSTAQAQVPLDRADPTITARQLPADPAETPAATPEVAVPAAPAVDRIADRVTGPLRAVSIEGREQLPATAFADVIREAVGRRMTKAGLGDLANAVGGIARARGYPFATASIAAQAVQDGILRVTLDLGRVDAVRVIGATNAQADRLLAERLVTGRGVRLRELEAALLLVGDIPGVRVTDSRYTRQNGFGILLVTIATDRAQAYAQVDNRGSREVGPIRSTMLASLRGVAGAGDELAAIVSQTPLQPSEFIFVRGRYSAPVDRRGSTLSASLSVGRSHPGGALAALDVVGNSVDVAATYTRPLLRTRNNSLWAQLEFRALSSDQTLSGIMLRRDRLAMASASINGVHRLAGGTLRSELNGVVGLPLAGSTRSGQALASRFDGDSRFVTASYLLDWSAPLAGPFSVALASAGQIASRPLLATAEIGLGGPVFGRGYDYAERTGDKGIMGAAEVRADLGRVAPGIVSRWQTYGFLDAGRVSNLRGGTGGGSLVSTGIGMRIGRGKVDGMVEAAFPLNADRFDTRDRSPRISARLSVAF